MRVPVCQQININDFYRESQGVPPALQDLNGDGNIDKGEVLSLLEIVITDYYIAEVKKKNSLIEDIESQASRCKLKFKELLEDE